LNGPLRANVEMAGRNHAHRRILPMEIVRLEELPRPRARPAPTCGTVTLAVLKLPKTKVVEPWRG